MKYIKLIIVLLFIVFLTGCKESNVPITNLDFLKEAANSIVMQDVFKDNFEYIEEFEYEGQIISVEWKSNRVECISNFGVVKRGYKDEEVVLTATYSYLEEKYIINYNVMVPAYTYEERFLAAFNEIALDEIVEADINLRTRFYDDEIVAIWKSSHPEIINDKGEYTAPLENTEVVLTLILNLGSESMEKDYIVSTKAEPKKINYTHHLVLDDAVNYDPNFMENCHIEGKYLVLDDDALVGTYLSNIYDVADFKSVVGSWGALSSKDATVELEVRCLVDGKWSMYISYGEWGLGLENKPMSNNTNDSIVKLSTDEIKMMGTKKGDALQYRVTLRRTSSLVSSPCLELVALAIEYNKYSYPIDVTSLPTSINHDVPKLNQNIVPVIGNSICSPTSSTMLMKYKGLSFADKDEYEHRYIANLVIDHSNDIFGNWVYNTVTMSAFGLRAYTMRMYSLEELQYHLANVGPVALSVKGKMVAYDKDKTYTTGGHLLVATGYYEKDGKVIFICNDPNISEVYVEYTYETIEDVWRMVAYIVE